MMANLSGKFADAKMDVHLWVIEWNINPSRKNSTWKIMVANSLVKVFLTRWEALEEIKRIRAEFDDDVAYRAAKYRRQR